MSVDIDGVLVVVYSEKQDAAATWKKTFGHHPLFAFVDHGPEGSGEPVAGLLRPGNAGSNTAADHIETARLALAQLPKKYRRGRRTLIRADSAGGTHDFVHWLTARGRWLSYSVRMVITDAIHHAVLQVPASAWMPAVEPGGDVRDGVWVAELAGGVLKGRPKGMRLIVRKERPHPGAQLRITDADGMRITCFATTPPAPRSRSWSFGTASGPGNSVHRTWSPPDTPGTRRAGRTGIRARTWAATGGCG